MDQEKQTICEFVSHWYPPGGVTAVVEVTWVTEDLVVPRDVVVRDSSGIRLFAQAPPGDETFFDRMWDEMVSLPVEPTLYQL